MALTLGSLFSGIGGIDLAFSWAGFDIAWQVEIDDYCNRVLRRHWPDVPRYGDVRACTGRAGKGWRRYHRLPRVDVVAGGFPCQPFSAAGLRRGGEDPRNLWPEFRRLLGELRPRVALLENVPALTAGYGTVVAGDLAALGYGAAWGIISAADAGAHHLRWRWWCVAVADADGQWEQQSQGGIVAGRRRLDDGNSALVNVSGNGRQSAVGDADGQQRQEQRRTQSDGTEWTEPGRSGGWRAESCVGRGADGLPARLDGAGWWRGWPAGRGSLQHGWEPPRTVPPGSVSHRVARLRALGNAVVPQVVYPLAVEIKRLLEQELS